LPYSLVPLFNAPSIRRRVKAMPSPFPPVLDRSGVLCPVCISLPIEAHYGYDLLGALGIECD